MRSPIASSGASGRGGGSPRGRRRLERGRRRAGAPGRRWRPPRLRRPRSRSASAAAWRWARAKSFRSARRSSESLEPAPSVPRPTRDAGRARGGVGEDPADRELHVGDRVGDDGGAAGGDQVELFVVEPDAVGEHGALARAGRGRRGRRRDAAVLARCSPRPRARSRRGGSGPATSRSAESSAIQRSDSSLTV